MNLRDRGSRIVVAVVAVGAIASAGLPGNATSKPQEPPDVYKVPKSLADDCSVPVEGEITNWLATLPDGAKVQFGPRGCYGQDGTITLTNKNGLVINGQGSEFRALTPGDSHRANWRFVGGSDLTVRNMAVRGSNPDGVYQGGFEWQHGYSVEGVQGMTLSKVKARAVWGDGVYLDKAEPTADACADDSSARDVLITGALLERIGRMGVAVVDAERVTLRDSTIGPVALVNVDLEPDDNCELARHIMVARNSFGANSWGVVVNYGANADPYVGDVSVIDNLQTAPGRTCLDPVQIGSPPGLYRYDYSFSGNQFMTHSDAFFLIRLQDVDVSSNSVSFTNTLGCDRLAGVRLTDSHTVGITGNIFSGASSVFVADGLSTGITATGNILD
jgi:hypothetical protein